ncbi:MAG: FHA domain-containing protein [Prevotella sp.]|nr:FHA domain-containing protein [Prevotella sp.]
MIICPNCKEEIDDDSHYCDQCGQALLYCNSCGRVGLGRRCTSCGGLMVTLEELQRRREAAVSSHSSMSMGFATHGFVSNVNPQMPVNAPLTVPVLTLTNGPLNIRMQGINGAIIGRRQGPYTQFFTQNRYVSGAHAQLSYTPAAGWCITDKNSSNGTMLNERPLQPEIDMSLKNGDIVTIANISLEVSIG